MHSLVAKNAFHLRNACWRFLVCSTGFPMKSCPRTHFEFFQIPSMHERGVETCGLTLSDHHSRWVHFHELRRSPLDSAFNSALVLRRRALYSGAVTNASLSSKKIPPPRPLWNFGPQLWGLRYLAWYASEPKVVLAIVAATFLCRTTPDMTRLEQRCGWDRRLPLFCQAKKSLPVLI